MNRSSLQNAQRKDQRNFVQNLFKVYFKKSQQSISSNKISFFIHIKVREGESGHLNIGWPYFQSDKSGLSLKVELPSVADIPI